ncbi:MAG: exodeoxyribonuclease VII large subunit [Limnobacter sp.]|nr:exodeoxyribonuclease VII large subunit [Limnobacter sp.]
MSNFLKCKTGMIESKTPFSVSELSAYLNQILRSNLPVAKVVGEISQLTRASSGHWYLTLKDNSAQIKAVMFRQRNVLVGFVPQLGDQVEILAQVSVYEPRGDLQLTIETLKRAGQGSLFEQFVKLKEKLTAEGLFDAEHKRPLPQYVFRVGVITSLQAAALADIRRALQRRVPHIQYHVHHTLVQGEGAATAIVKALRDADAQGYDVLILARGGGSLEDLWSFNEEAVVRQVHACETPIVVGVGHESDFTLAELAADLRAATPTAAVELISRSTAELLGEVEYRYERMQVMWNRQMQRLAQKVDRAEMGLVTPDKYVERLGQRTDNAWGLLRQNMNNLVDRCSRSHAQTAQSLRRHVAQNLRDLSSDLQSHTLQLQSLRHKVEQREDLRLQKAEAVLQALSPQRNLEKGYAFMQVPSTDGSGKVVASIAQAAVGSMLEATLADGKLTLEVQEKRAS